jgi:voltage-gated potassium channel
MVSRIDLKQWERHAEWPLAGLALVFLAVYSVEVLTRPRGSEAHVLLAVTWIIWCLFALDYLARLRLAPDPPRWFLRHLFELAIVALPLLRPLRLLRLVLLIEALQRAIGKAFPGRIAVYTASGISLVGVVTASLATWIIQRVSESEIEHQAATAAHIEELRNEIRELRQELRGSGMIRQ